jgi:hypothetical protein
MRVRSVAAALGLTLCLAACSEEAREPSALPTLDPSASPTSSEAAEATPTGIDAPTPEGAGAFARYWFTALNEAARSGDTATLRSLSDESCETCRLYAESIEDLYGPGGRIEGGVFSLRAAEAPGLEPNASEARVTVVFDVTATRQVGADGETLREVPALSAVAAEMLLRRTDSGWVAATLDIE